jgi:hypothetical protein
VIESEKRSAENASANSITGGSTETAENNENTAPESDNANTNSTNTNNTPTTFDTPLLTAITQKIGGFILAQNPDWDKVSETSNEYLNQQFMIQPRLLRGQAVELSER